MLSNFFAVDKMLVLLFCCFSAVLTAQCNFRVGDPIAVQQTGTPNPSGTTVYYLVDGANGRVLDRNNADPSFAVALAKGAYTVYALNFTEPPTAGLSIGGNFAPRGGCFALAALPITVCDETPNLNLCQGEDVVVVSNPDFNLDNRMAYALVDNATASIVDLSFAAPSAVFVAPPAGSYTVYALNYDPSENPAAAGLAVGASYPLSPGFAAGCFAVQMATANVVAAGSNVYLANASTNGQALALGCEQGGWTYYADPSDLSRLLFAVQWNPSASPGLNNLARSLAQVQLWVEPSYYLSTQTVPDPRGTWVMRRYWNVDLQGSSLDAPVNIRFYYAPTEVADIVAAGDAWRLANGGSDEGFMWFKTLVGALNPSSQITPNAIAEGNNLELIPAGSGQENGVDYVQFDGIVSFSGGSGAKGVGPNTPLPLQAWDFSAQAQGAAVQLQWSVEVNPPARRFELQRSSNAWSFETIATLAANGQARGDYEHWDQAPLAGWNYYRLIMEQADGQRLISPVRAVYFQPNLGDLVVFPNPFRHEIRLRWPSQAQESQWQLQLVDVLGRVLWQEQVTVGMGGQEEVLALPHNLKAGVYWLQAQDNQGRKYGKALERWEGD